MYEDTKVTKVTDTWTNAETSTFTNEDVAEATKASAYQIRIDNLAHNMNAVNLECLFVQLSSRISTWTLSAIRQTNM